jgi:HNH endonuclease
MNTEDPKSRRPVPSAARDEVLKRYGYRCAVCGSNGALELSHIVPRARGGDASPKNLMVLCPSCHYSLDKQPREIEFVGFLAELLRSNEQYSQIHTEALLGDEQRLRADLVVWSKHPSPGRTLIIECKTSPGVGSGWTSEVIRQVKNYAAHLPDSHPVLAIPASLQPKDASAVREAGIELWDLSKLGEMFTTQLQKAPVSFYSALILANLAACEPVAKQLSDSLAKCSPGKTEWLVYQSLVGDILEELFYPALRKPIAEHSDKARANRRDFIMPNYAENGFWAFIREKYQADYVVVDAKNYSRKASKADVLQIANYLKPHGAGMFGLIFSRLGGDTNGCDHTLREQWALHRKLILILDDADILAMLAAKAERRPPEDLLGQKLDAFRLSM